MDNNLTAYENLKQAWRTLNSDVKRNKKVKFELFKTAFSETYTLLANHLAEGSLDKRYVEIIAEAFLFANTKDDSLDENCLAAFVLTERMLTYCAFNKVPAAAGTVMIYVAEARREVCLSFEDVDESISELSKIFRDLFWRNNQI